MPTAPTSETALDRMAQRAQRLYSLPAVAVKVLELTRDTAIDATALKQCIANDPALIAKILRVVNSSLYGLRGQIADLNQAVAILGVNPLKLLVLGFSLPPDLLSDLEATALARFWQRTLIKAAAAREIFEQVWNESGDEGFLAGLLQDVGALVLIQQLGEPYLALLMESPRAEDVARLESATLGFEHRELSAQLLQQWRLPQALAQAVLRPACYSGRITAAPRELRLAVAVELAGRIAEFLLHQQTHDLARLLIQDDAAHGLELAELESLLTSVEGKLPLLAEVFSAPLPSSRPYSAILLEAYQRLSDETELSAAARRIDAPRADAPRPQPTEPRLPGIAATPLTTVAESDVALPAVRPPLAAAAAPEAVRTTARSGLDSAGAAGVSATAVTTPGVRQRHLETGSDALLARLNQALAQCHGERRPLSLALFELDRAAELLLTTGQHGLRDSLQCLTDRIEEFAPGEYHLVGTDDFRIAAVLPGADRSRAVEFARHVVKFVGQTPLTGTRRGSFSISVSGGVAGIAIPARNFPADDLLAAATRCLNGVRMSGGNGVKSIDV